MATELGPLDVASLDHWAPSGGPTDLHLMVEADARLRRRIYSIYLK
jgi:hypothetical protein